METEHKAKLWVLVMLFCGLRPGETFRVRYAHFDHEKNRLFIDGAKTKNAARTVPVPGFIMRGINGNPCDLVFTNTYGDPLTKVSSSRLFRSFWEEMNKTAGAQVYKGHIVPPYKIDTLVAYNLRHTYASMLRDALLPDRIIKLLMGHSNDITDNYMHETEDALKIAGEYLNKYWETKSVAQSVAVI